MRLFSLESTESRTKKLARQILELLAFSFSPLTLSEICEFLENGLVTLAHHSVKTYLISDMRGDASYFRLSEDEAHRNIAIKCLVYLSFKAFSNGPCVTYYEIGSRYQRYPLLDYAAQRWAKHTEKLPDLGDSLWGVLKPFLFSADDGRGNFLAWVKLLIPECKNTTRTEPLYYAALFGLTTVVRYLLEAGAGVEVRGGRCGATPINIASFRGNTDVVELLLEYGADPYKPDETPGWHSIDWARAHGFWDIVELCHGIQKAKLDGKAIRRLRRPNYRHAHPGVNPMQILKVQMRPAWSKKHTTAIITVDTPWSCRKKPPPPYWRSYLFGGEIKPCRVARKGSFRHCA